MQILRDLQREILYVRIPKGLRVWAWVRVPVSREGIARRGRAAGSLLSGNRQSSWRALQSMYTANRRALGSSSSHFLSGERPHPSSTASTIGFGSLRHSAAGWLRWMHSSGRLPAQHDFLGKRRGGPSECQAEIRRDQEGCGLTSSGVVWELSQLRAEDGTC